MRCPSCGEDNGEGAKFCHACGAALERELACQNCGTPYQPGHKRALSHRDILGA
jgi:predicted amidophosphoribosyltransferase